MGHSYMGPVQGLGFFPLFVEFFFFDSYFGRSPTAIIFWFLFYGPTHPNFSPPPDLFALNELDHIFLWHSFIVYISLSITSKMVFQVAINAAISRITACNAVVGTLMGLVFVCGKNSHISTGLIYGPALALLAYSIKKQLPVVFSLSIFVSICHALAHVIYPFLDEVQGVNTGIDVWQDQSVHLFQSLFVSCIFFGSPRNFPLLVSLFVLANVANVVLGYFCWGQSCHDTYVWVTLAPALASGLSYAAAGFFQTPKEVATLGFLLQGSSSVMTFFAFKASINVLKVNALCRFFEIYFIAPHYVAFFCLYYATQATTSPIDGLLRRLGSDKATIVPDLQKNPYFMAEVDAKDKKM